MNPRMAVSVLIGVFSVLVTILALQGLVAGEWTTVAQATASVVVMIAIIGFVIVLGLKHG